MNLEAGDKLTLRAKFIAPFSETKGIFKVGDVMTSALYSDIADLEPRQFQIGDLVTTPDGSPMKVIGIVDDGETAWLDTGVHVLGGALILTTFYHVDDLELVTPCQFPDCDCVDLCK